MAIPSGVSKVQIYGTLLGGQEIFETGYWIGQAPGSDADSNTLAEELAADFELNGWPSMQDTLKSGDYWRGVKLYSYPTGGPRATHIGLYALPTPLAGDGAGEHPLQTCLVTTLLTGFAGRRNRGRMYWPARGADIQGGKFTQAMVDKVVQGWAAHFTSVNNTSRGPVVVVSPTGSARRDATLTKGDDLPDIQRRRANKLTASYTHQSAPL